MPNEDNNGEGGVSAPPSQPLDAINRVTQPTVKPAPAALYHKNQIRGWITVWILIVFTVEVFALIACAVFKEASLPAVKDAMSLIFSSTVALLGAATGFYFAKDTNDIGS